MDIEERMAKAETEISILKAMQVELRSAMERGFSEQRAAIERGFSEERTARERGVRWSIGISLTILALVLSILTRLSGLL